MLYPKLRLTMTSVESKVETPVLTGEKSEFTFKLTEVKDAPRVFPELAEEDVVTHFKKNLSCNKMHAISKMKMVKYGQILGPIINCFHDACHMAFATHCPLILSPDMFWTIIMQGVANHVNQNSEKCRKAFVTHEEKAKITVRRDEFSREPGKNDWTTVFGDFSKEIKTHIGDKTHTMIVNDFSTTGPTERIVSEIVMMDMLQAYFAYGMTTMCGIPSITMKGSEEDWKKLYEKVISLCKFNSEEKLEMDGWLKELQPVMESICHTRSGKIDKKFWESLYKINNESGGPYVSGWISVLFPYINDKRELKPNPYLDWKKNRMFGGLKYNNIPNGVATVPFVWNYMGEEINMNFFGGMIGVSQDPKTFAVKAEFGYIVNEKN